MRGPKAQKLSKGSIHTVKRDQLLHVISESYAYKTDPYYTILTHELRGEPVAPDSRSVLDALIVPICLERARKAGIPVAEYVISQSYAQYPALLYGLNYFSSSSEFTLVRNPVTGKEVIRHITNGGKYPFCYQWLDEDSVVLRVNTIFGRIGTEDKKVTRIAEAVYREFRIPLVNLVLIERGGSFLLSALTSTPYRKMSAAETALLMAYITRQEFL